MPQHSPQTALELTSVNVTLNRPDVQRLDALALQKQTNRSALVRAALQQYLQGQEQQSIRLQSRKRSA